MFVEYYLETLGWLTIGLVIFLGYQFLRNFNDIRRRGRSLTKEQLAAEKNLIYVRFTLHLGILSILVNALFTDYIILENKKFEAAQLKLLQEISESIKSR